LIGDGGAGCVHYSTDVFEEQEVKELPFSGRRFMITRQTPEEYYPITGGVEARKGGVPEFLPTTYDGIPERWKRILSQVGERFLDSLITRGEKLGGRE